MTLTLLASGQDIKSALEAVQTLPPSLAPVGLVGAAVGFGLGAGLASYAQDKGWGDPGSMGPFYWGPCITVGIVLMLLIVYH
jgi:hypothetical protein